jgi:hypothetical protein
MELNPYDSSAGEPNARVPIEPQRKQVIVNIGAGVGAVVGMLAVFEIGAYGLVSALVLIAGGAFAGCLTAGLIATVVWRGK